jgi:hypothetical protein
MEAYRHRVPAKVGVWKVHQLQHPLTRDFYFARTSS